MGSLYLSMYSFQTGVFFGGVSTFSPCLSREAITSAALRPSNLISSFMSLYKKGVYAWRDRDSAHYTIQSYIKMEPIREPSFIFSVSLR